MIGLGNENIQNKLMTIDDLNFDKACKIAVAMELADKGTKDFVNQGVDVNCNNESGVNVLTSKGRPNLGLVHKRKASQGDTKPTVVSKDRCGRCNGNHDYLACRFKSATCFSCGKIGHISVACKNISNLPRPSKGKI